VDSRHSFWNLTHLAYTYGITALASQRGDFGISWKYSMMGEFDMKTPCNSVHQTELVERSKTALFIFGRSINFPPLEQSCSQADPASLPSFSIAIQWGTFMLRERDGNVLGHHTCYVTGMCLHCIMMREEGSYIHAFLDEFKM